MPLWRKRARDPPGRVLAAPRFDPGADARLQRSDDFPGDAGVDILPFCILHCLFLSFASGFLMTRALKGRAGWSDLSPKGNGQHGRTAGTNGAGSAVDGARRPAHDRGTVMRKPCGKRERTRVADAAGISTAKTAISRCSSAERPHCWGAVDGLGCREDLQHDRLFNRAIVGRFGKQTAVIEIEGGGSRCSTSRR